MSVEEITDHVKEATNIYSIATKVMQNFLGKSSYPYLTEAKQLYPYIVYLCGEQDQDKHISRHDWFQAELQGLQLIVVIRDAKLMHSKYKALSRVRCKLWVQKGALSMTYKTSVKETISDLVWDEVFILDIPNYDADSLHIEVWSKPLESKDKGGTKVIGRESLVGDIVKQIKNLPCTGQDKLWSVKKGPRRMQVSGQLNVFIQLATKQKDDHNFHIHMHVEFLKLSYEKQLASHEETAKSVKWKNWLEILPNAAVTLLQQHALQNGITPTEQCVCSWIVASSLKINQEERISFYFLRDLLEGLVSDTYEDPICDYLEGALHSSISEFFDHTSVLLQILHKKFEVGNIEDADELFYMLKCMISVDVQSIKNYLESYSVIAEEGKSWYSHALVEVKEDLKAKDITIERSCDILKCVIKMYLRNQIILDDIFTRAWSVTYSQITYKALDEVLNEAVKPFIEHLRLIMVDAERRRVVQESLAMLQLYHNVRNLVNYVLKDLPNTRDTLSMDAYSLWFGESLIMEWFLLCDMYTKPFIERAISFDQMVRLDEYIPHGSSVPDIVAIIDEMVIDVWAKLNWNEQFYTHVALIEAVRTCVLDYLMVMSKRIKSENFFCQKSKFEVNEKVCVALSNVYSLFEHLFKTKNKVQTILKISETNLGFTMMDPMSSIVNEVQMKVSAIFLSVLNQFGKRLRKLTKRVLKGRLDVFGSHATIVADTCAYVENTLKVFYENLKPELFYIVLRQMWIMVVITVRDGLSVWKGCALVLLRKKSAYISALQALTQMQQIFYCDGHGLSTYDLQSLVVKELQAKFKAKIKNLK